MKKYLHTVFPICVVIYFVYIYSTKKMIIKQCLRCLVGGKQTLFSFVFKIITWKKYTKYQLDNKHHLGDFSVISKGFR